MLLPNLCRFRWTINGVDFLNAYVENQIILNLKNLIQNKVLKLPCKPIFSTCSETIVSKVHYIIIFNNTLDSTQNNMQDTISGTNMFSHMYLI
jgi:hypothetical protein